MHRVRSVACVAILAACMIAAASRPATAQMDMAILTGRVSNPKGLAVAGARIRIVRQATGVAKETTTNKQGSYFFLGLQPGAYQFTVLANGFATLLNHSLTLGVGRREVYNVALQIATQEQIVKGEPAPIDTSRSSSEMTITGRQIRQLPINRRDYLQFTLLASPVKRDTTPLAAAIPTSGFDFNGQRARGNEVLLDGADAIGETTGTIRSTLSQGAVRDFHVIENNYMPEYGRSIGGVINVTSQSGTNTMHGDVYGYLRNSRIQARDPFSAVKEPSTRVQAGGSIGGALQQGKTFYFLAGEMLRATATGFSSIGNGNFGLSQQTVPCLSSPVLMTAPQAAFFNSPGTQNALTSAGGCNSQTGTLLMQAESMYGTASTTALYGNTANGPNSFPLPVYCPEANCPSSNVVPLPQDYLGLSSLVGTYPTKEHRETGSVRLDHIWNQRQRTFVLYSITPSYSDGILQNVPGQNLQQVAGTRAAAEHFQDQMGEGQHTMMLSTTLLNQIRIQYSRRGYRYNNSPLTGGSNVGVNIPGYAYFGREPFSTLDFLERRYEAADDMTWVHGHHTIRFGVDANFVQITTPKGQNQIFDLNYGGAYNFGTLDASSVPYAPLSQLAQQTGEALPAFTSLQTYGLGMPGSFIQGFGKSDHSFDDKMLGGFWQDSWQLSSRLTLNYGVRYDVAFTPRFSPPITVNQTNITQAAESAMNVVEGIPVDYKDFAPRLGVAWDPTGHGTTVVRAGFGLYYGVTPMAVIYDAAAADGVLSTQMAFPGGNATGVAVSPSSQIQNQVLNASSLFQGVLGGIPTIPATGTAVCGTNLPTNFGYVCGQQRFNPTASGSIFSNQNFLSDGFPVPILPSTLPVAKNFVSMYSEQGSLAIEHEFPGGFKVSASYTFVRGLHLNRARNINQANATLLAQNYANASAAGLGASGPLAVQVPLISGGGCNSTSATSSYQVIAPGELAQGFASANCASGTALGYIGTPAAFNDFRPSGPNPSYGGADVVGYSQLVSLAQTAGFPTGNGTPVPWGDVNQQESTGGSLYNGLTVTVSKRFSDRFELLSSWTWSHARDNTTDLTIFEQPQNNGNAKLEWANSAFDQRQRWVTSAIFDSPYSGKQKGFLKRLLENTSAAPIIEFGSGRPYTVLTGTDTNLNFNSYTDRPSTVPVGTSGSVTSPYIPNVAFAAPTVCAAGIPVSVRPYGCDGNLGRNSFVTPNTFNIDLRIDKKFYLGEKMNFEFIAEGFNLLNRFNVLAVNQMCDLSAGGTCTAGQPMAAFNPRQFQFALRFNF